MKVCQAVFLAGLTFLNVPRYEQDFSLQKLKLESAGWSFALVRISLSRRPSFTVKNNFLILWFHVRYQYL